MVAAAIMNGGLLAVALTGAYKVLNGQLEAGDVAALTLMLMNVYQPLNILGWAYREIKTGERGPRTPVPDPEAQA